MGPAKPDFLEHENLSGLSIIRLIYIKLYRKRKPNFGKKIWAKWESGLTTVQLKRDPPVELKIEVHFINVS